MKKFFKILLIVCFVAMFVGTFAFLWNKTRPKKVVYEVVDPQIDTVYQYVVATGNVEPRDEVLIKPQISGIISDVALEAGQMVKKGDVLATVKVIPDISSLNSAESRATLAQINYDQAVIDTKRTEELYERGVVSREDYEKSQVSLKTTREELVNAKDAYEITKNGLSERYASMSNTQIRATVDGMILDVPVKVGNSVIQSNTMNDGTTIASVADMNNMIFRGKVDESDVGKLLDNTDVKLTIGALQGIELDASLEYVSPKSTESNGVIMFEIKAAMKIPDGVFVRAGYSANANIQVDSREGVITVPESSLEFEDDKTYVYVLTSAPEAEEQVFERREVETGLSDGVNMEIVKGIEITDKVRGLLVE